MNQYIAKLSGNNQQTLQEHKEKLLENFEILKKIHSIKKRRKRRNRKSRFLSLLIS